MVTSTVEAVVAMPPALQVLGWCQQAQLQFEGTQEEDLPEKYTVFSGLCARVGFVPLEEGTGADGSQEGLAHDEMVKYLHLVALLAKPDSFASLLAGKYIQAVDSAKGRATWSTPTQRRNLLRDFWLDLKRRGLSLALVLASSPFTPPRTAAVRRAASAQDAFPPTSQQMAAPVCRAPSAQNIHAPFPSQKPAPVSTGSAPRAFLTRWAPDPGNTSAPGTTGAPSPDTPSPMQGKLSGTDSAPPGAGESGGEKDGPPSILLAQAQAGLEGEVASRRLRSGTAREAVSSLTDHALKPVPPYPLSHAFRTRWAPDPGPTSRAFATATPVTLCSAPTPYPTFRTFLAPWAPDPGAAWACVSP
jgi:hypothetical protein